MTRNNNTRRVVGAIACAVVLLASCTGRPPGPAAKARLAAVKEAVDSTIPGVTRLDDDIHLFGDQIHAQQTILGRHVCYLMVLRRLHDWSQVDPEAIEGGVAAALLQQARRHEQVLAKAGFRPLHAFGAGEGMWRTQARRGGGERTISVNTSASETWGSASGGGLQGYFFDLDAPRLVHWRLYFIPDCGVTLGVRMEYDQGQQVLLTEFCYSDRTVAGVEYPAGTATLTETIEP